ncbi:hypothetical protein [Thermosulfurimonas sp. F29]|uniref:hypothetical protein n=1 Tax=Thermosulfurimonas sp. F29 TaxID=2867247 RepID=UPI001C82C683|nr:hypothetical protein [Thermosulfurimonas sp. F29]MBX6423791.1 hypothetical protein [Thermosulfurimonas sp. F29]
MGIQEMRIQELYERLEKLSEASPHYLDDLRGLLDEAEMAYRLGDITPDEYKHFLDDLSFRARLTGYTGFNLDDHLEDEEDEDDVCSM